MHAPGDNLTEGAHRVLDLAREEAQRFNHNYISTEHLLLGLIRERAGVAGEALQRLGVNVTKVRSAVEFIIGRGEKGVTGDLGMTPRAKRVLALARDEAGRLGAEQVGTEHMLLGLIREGEGIASGVLESLGLNLEKVREMVVRILGGEAPREPSQPPRQNPLWEYLVVGSVSGEAEPLAERFFDHTTYAELVGEPMRRVVGTLAADGWVFVGTDPAYRTDAGPGALYVFKRRQETAE